LGETQLASIPADQRWITQIATALGIRVEVEPLIALSDGSTVQPWARVIDFGGTNGMLIFGDWADYRAHMSELSSLGYGVSSFREPSGSPVAEFRSTQEMLLDWTWTGPSSLKPGWLG
jgi:hypothetical protein